MIALLGGKVNPWPCIRHPYKPVGRGHKRTSDIVQKEWGYISGEPSHPDSEIRGDGLKKNYFMVLFAQAVRIKELVTEQSQGNNKGTSPGMSASCKLCL